MHRFACTEVEQFSSALIKYNAEVCCQQQSCKKVQAGLLLTCDASSAVSAAHLPTCLVRGVGPLVRAEIRQTLKDGGALALGAKVR